MTTRYGDYVNEHGTRLMTRADRAEVGGLVATGRMARAAAMEEYGVTERTVRRWARAWMEAAG